MSGGRWDGPAGERDDAQYAGYDPNEAQEEGLIMGIFSASFLTSQTQIITLLTISIHFLNPLLAISNYLDWVRHQDDRLGHRIVSIYLALCIIAILTYLLVSSVFYFWALRFASDEDNAKRRRIIGVTINLFFADFPIFALGVDICWSVGFDTGLQALSFIFSLLSFAYSAFRVWFFFMVRCIKTQQGTGGNLGGGLGDGGPGMGGGMSHAGMQSSGGYGGREAGWQSAGSPSGQDYQGPHSHQFSPAGGSPVQQMPAIVDPQAGIAPAGGPMYGQPAGLDAGVSFGGSPPRTGGASPQRAGGVVPRPADPGYHADATSAAAPADGGIIPPAALAGMGYQPARPQPGPYPP